MMRWITAVRLALVALTRRPLRALLTVLGITIGIGAVAIAMTMGESARRSVNEEIASLGANSLVVFPRSPRLSGASSSTVSRLSERDVEPLAEETSAIGRVAPIL